jgi:hypothetical protein
MPVSRFCYLAKYEWHIVPDQSSISFHLSCQLSRSNDWKNGADADAAEEGAESGTRI